MPYDSQYGLYYDVKLNNKEYLLDPTILSDFKAVSSVFSLFPTISSVAVNKDNVMASEGLLAVGNPVKIEMGVSEGDDEFEEYKNFIIEFFPYTSL